MYFNVERNSSFDSTLIPGDMESHEVANVQILYRRGVIEVQVSTASSFANPPAIQLQKENGHILKPDLIKPVESDGSFVAHFSMENEVVLEGLVDVRGTSSHGNPISAVESFLVTCFHEEGEYQIFGAHGLVSLEGMKVKEEPPLVASIGPAPVDVLEDVEDLLAVSPAFLVSADSGGKFHRPLRLMISIADAPSKVFSGDSCTPKASIYYWQERGRDWKKVSGRSIVNPTVRIVETSILKSGVYAALVEGNNEGGEDNAEIISNKALLEKVVKQQEEIGQLRFQLENRRENEIRLNRVNSNSDDVRNEEFYSWW